MVLNLPVPLITDVSVNAVKFIIVFVSLDIVSFIISYTSIDEPELALIAKFISRFTSSIVIPDKFIFLPNSDGTLESYVGIIAPVTF